MELVQDLFPCHREKNSRWYRILFWATSWEIAEGAGEVRENPTAVLRAPWWRVKILPKLWGSSDLNWQFSFNNSIPREWGSSDRRGQQATRKEGTMADLCWEQSTQTLRGRERTEINKEKQTEMITCRQTALGFEKLKSDSAERSRNKWLILHQTSLTNPRAQLHCTCMTCSSSLNGPVPQQERLTEAGWKPPGWGN